MLELDAEYSNFAETKRLVEVAIEKINQLEQKYKTQ
jgi:hypothetical protein